MARAAGAPGASPDQPADSSEAGSSVARSRPTESDAGRPALTAWELADAVWLASTLPDAPAEPPHSEPREVPPPIPKPVAEERDPGPDSSPPDVEGEFPPPPPEPAGHAVAEKLVTESVPLHLLPGERDSVPEADALLPDSLGIIRALWPLKRKVPSRRPDRVVLDETATAERAAEDGLWWPITKPITEPWLDLTLVVDAGPSMALWRARVSSFISLLERHNAFKTVQIRLLDTRPAADGLPTTPVLRGGTLDAPARDHTELLDPSGRRIVLVITDGVADAWRHDLVGPLLAQWAQALPVSVVNLLPRRLWTRTGLAVERAALTVPAALRPNRQWLFDLPDSWLGPDPLAALPDGTVPIPILELRPTWLRWWAHLISATHRGPAAATVLLSANKPRPYVGGATSFPDSPTPVERFSLFRGAASPPAFRLATLLASVPVTLPIAQTIRAELVPDAKIEHVAEVLCSGLLYASPPTADGSSVSWASSTFDFPEAVRELLLSCARRSETARAVKAVATRFGSEFGAVAQLWEAITDPDATADPQLPEQIALERVVMRALSGPYKSRADRLSNSSESIQQPIQTKPTETTKPRESKDMSTAQRSADRPDEPTVTVRSTSEAPDPSADEQVTEPRTRAADGALADPPVTYPPPATRERGTDDAPPVWGNVPPRNLNFTGRGELLELLSKRLTAGGTTAVLPAALHGMGGIGKTQMAVEYIYRHLRDYEVIWWIQAATDTQIRAGLTELARQLRLPGSHEANTAVPAVREALRLGKPYSRWLLVFDAAESPDAVRRFFPTNGPGEILITSRNPDWAGVARPLEISVFKREESKELLRRRGPEIDDADAETLADKLGDLPLAIEQAAAWRAETGMPVREYLRLFDEKVAEILDTSAPPDYELSVAAAWNVSFDELRTRNPAANQILHICAFFAPEPISRDLFTGVRGVTISPELDVALRDPMQLARAIRDINRYGLAKIDHGNDTIQLHRLVQIVLRNRERPPQLQAQMKHGAHQLIANLDPRDPESRRSWPRYRELLPHAYAADVIECDDAWVRQFVIHLMRFLFQWGDHEEAYRLAQRTYDHFLATLGSTNSQTLDVASRLGSYMRTIGRFSEAAELNKHTLELHVNSFGENSEETLNAQLNVVIDLRHQGDFAASRKLSEELYQKSLKLFGAEDPEALKAAYQHALSLRMSGEYRAAAELDAETYRRRVEVLGFDHIQTLSTRAALITDRREAGDYVWARGEQEKLSELMWERYGEDTADTWTMSFLLAVARRKDGDHTGALSLSGPALDHFRVRYGDNHSTKLAAALAYSIDLRHSDALPEARELGEDTFERYRGRLGEHHPHTYAALVDLALTLRLTGDAVGARELDERSLEHLRERVGPDHPYAIVAAINLASDLAASGELDAAVALDTETVDRATRVLGADHPTTLAVALNLGLDLRAIGRAKEAEPQYTDALIRYRKVLGEGHPGTMAAARAVRADCDIDPMLM